jgi:hypothetical protein
MIILSKQGQAGVGTFTYTPQFSENSRELFERLLFPPKFLKDLLEIRDFQTAKADRVRISCENRNMN